VTGSGGIFISASRKSADKVVNGRRLIKQLAAILCRLSRILLPVLLASVYALIPIQVKASTPVVENEPAKNIYADAALLNCYISDLGNCSWYDIYFVYYAEGSSRQKTDTQHFTELGEASIYADYLSPSTRYFFYPVVVTVGGTDEITQPTLTFTTPAVVDPTVILMPPTDITQTSVTLNCNITSMGNCFHGAIYFLYGPVGPNVKKSATQDFTAPGEVNIPISDLSPGVTYSFYAVMSYCLGEKSFEPLSFTTLATSPGLLTAGAAKTEPVTTNKTSGMPPWVPILIGVGVLTVLFFVFRLMGRIKKA
jgi:hypothetical protein